MSRFRLFVEGKEMDTPDGLSAQLTYTIDDIKDFAARNTSFSKTIVLPGTGRNKRLFGHVFELGSANFYDSTLPNIEYNYNAAKSAKALITYDNMPVFKGVIRILEIIVDGERIEFETAVFGELGGLVAAIGENRLEALDFSAYNHLYEYTAVNDSWNAAPGSGYYYPLIDYGYTADGITFPFETMRPAFYAKEYIDKIFQAAGYTYESAFLNSDHFKRLIIPFNGERPGFEVASILKMTDFADPLVPFGSSAEVMEFDQQEGPGYMTVSNNGSRFTWGRAGNINPKISFACGWSRNSTGGNDLLHFDLLVNGGVVFSHILNAGSATTGAVSWNTKTELSQNDYVELRVWATSGFTFWSTFNASITISGDPVINLPIAFGDEIVANSMIPKNILQRDFLSSIIKMFNLYVDEVRDRDKHLLIEPYNEYYAGNEVVNWDEKLDRLQVVKLKPMGEHNARLYEFKYKDDSDHFNDRYKKKWNETYGTYLYDSGYEFAKAKKTVEVIFSATPSIQYEGTTRVIPAIYKKTNTTIEPVAHNIRILYRAEGQVIGDEVWNLVTPAGSLPITGYPYAGHLDDPDAPGADLNFGTPKELYFILATGDLSANLVNVYWSFYLSEITDKDSKVLTGFFRLTPLDMYHLNFSKFVYVGGQLWRLNAVVDYALSAPELTKCELLKVRDMV